MPGNVRAPFKYTIPITRASTENGEMFIEGEATGPEIDAFGSRMDPMLVENFALQIAERAASGNPIPYRDTHGMGVTDDNGVMADLGELVAAGLTDDQHLRVRVHLDRDNPAARYLHLQIHRGKQYGMSIGGTVVDWVDEYMSDLRRVVRTFKTIVLDHIANTTQPAWTPSLGTVLTRAVDRALQGENMDPENVPAPTPEVEGEPESAEVTTEAVAEATAEESAPVEEVVETVAEAAAEDPAPVAETAAEPQPQTIPVSAFAPIVDAVNALATAVGAVMPAPVPVPAVITRSEDIDAARSVESESPVAEDDPIVALRAAVESLRTELAEANDRIRQLSAEPAGNEPQVIERSETSLNEALRALDPHQRLLLGLEAAKAQTK